MFHAANGVFKKSHLMWMEKNTFDLLIQLLNKRAHSASIYDILISLMNHLTVSTILSLLAQRQSIIT